MIDRLNAVEEEVIFLKAINEIIDSVINLEVLELRGHDPDTNIFFPSITHQRFFNIILVDFLSRTEPRAFVNPTTYLGALRSISQNPSFNTNNSVTSLREATYSFVDWLRQNVEVETHLPSINFQGTLNLPRIDFIKMCGNIAKHNILRSVGIAEQLIEILAVSGRLVGLDDALLALNDFYERYHVDILNYHGSTLAEFINNIRWGIYQYLQPELQRSLVWENIDPPKYHYTYPNGVATRFAQECYWDLMNQVRSHPYIRRFEVARWLKQRY